MTCPNCGAQVASKAHFCSNCGFNLAEYFEQHPDLKSVGKGNLDQSNPNYNGQFDRITDWVSNNGMVVLIGAIVTIILMSGSHTLGWTALIIDFILIYLLGSNYDGEDSGTLNSRLENHVDRVGGHVITRIEERTSLPEDMTERQQKVQEKTGGLNFNLITILIAAISLVIVFYGPFGSQMMLGTAGETPSIYNALLTFAHYNTGNILLGYSALSVVLGVPILIILLTLSNRKGTNRIAFVLSIIETLVLIFIAVRILNHSIMFDGFGSLGVDETLKGTMMEKRMFGITIGFGISSYLLLLSSVLMNISTWLNRR